MSDAESSDTEQYEDAVCPGCGTVLSGSREPGDEDTCGETGKTVTLVEADDLLPDGLQTESPLGSAPEEDVSCADCGEFRTLVGPIAFDGRVVEGADFVCRRCARKRSLNPAIDRSGTDEDTSMEGSK